MATQSSLSVPAIKVHQWLESWNDVPYQTDEAQSASVLKRRRKPEPHFYIFTLPAQQLKKLSQVYTRTDKGRRDAEAGIQRTLQNDRTVEIRQFIEHGYPWSTLSKTQRELEKNAALHMPGWLPTAIIANILAPNTKRKGQIIREEDLITIDHTQTKIANLILPGGITNPEWDPLVPPLEIIDGQHRLSAFSSEDVPEGDFEFPIIAFFDLDITWQAYLFYTINIKPKKINQSLAYDLYPLLRVQDWLEQGNDKLEIYRETRAQELTEVLWAHDLSPWKSRIDMLSTTRGKVSQYAAVRALIESFLSLSSSRRPIGGLFQEEIELGFGIVEPLLWDRTRQAALLVLIWRQIADEVAKTRAPWAVSIRNALQPRLISQEDLGEQQLDLAFSDSSSLLAQDQGFRPLLRVMNELLVINANNLKLQDIKNSDQLEDSISLEDVTNAYQDLQKAKVGAFIAQIAKVIATFDWRSLNAPGLSEQEKLLKQVYRGTGGYRVLKEQLLQHLVNSTDQNVKNIAEQIIKLG